MHSPATPTLIDSLAEAVRNFNDMSKAMRMPRTTTYRSVALFSAALAFATRYPELAARILSEADVEGAAASAADSFAKQLSGE